MPENVKITTRHTYNLNQYQIHVIYVYRCPHDVEKEVDGFSPVTKENPLENEGILQALLDAADRDAIRKAKVKCFGGNYEKKKLAVSYRKQWSMLHYKPVQQSTIASFEPDKSYDEKKAEFKTSHPSQTFVSKQEYRFLENYYNFKPSALKGMNQGKKLELKIKFSGVIDTWGTVAERKKKIREKAIKG
jgi:hypothetical protein